MYRDVLVLSEEQRIEFINGSLYKLKKALESSSDDLKEQPSGDYAYEVHFLTEKYNSHIGNVHMFVAKEKTTYLLESPGLSVSYPVVNERLIVPLDIISARDELLQYLSGQEIEKDTGNALEETNLIRDWTDWKRLLNHQDTYETGIHPAVISTVLGLAGQITGDITIVDLFGGDGKMLRKLHLLLLNNPNRQVQSHLIDANLKQLGDAQMEILDTAEFTGDPRRPLRYINRPEFGNFHIHPPTDLTVSREILSELPAPNIITSVGGLNRSVIRRDDALKIARSIYSVLLPGGAFVYSGYSDCLLNARHLQNIGFSIENLSVPRNIFQNSFPSQLYVARKK